MINKKPFIEVASSENECWQGWAEIGDILLEHLKRIQTNRIVITIESNLGTYLETNLRSIKEKLNPNVTCRAIDIYKDEKEIYKITKKDLDVQKVIPNVVSDIEEYFDPQKLEALRSNINFIEQGVILIHGIGASKIWEPDILIYSDISRWEQLQRFRRSEITNIGVNNVHLPFDVKKKWNYFIDLKICHKIKKEVIQTCDYFLETNDWKKPKLATGEIIRNGYETIYTQPFFNAPFFDPELWEKPTRQQGKNEFKWIFNCNLDENNILFKLGKHLFESPAVNLLYFNPIKLLGADIFKKHGLELTVRYNFIDTLEEGDNNLYAYPPNSYMMDEYGIDNQTHESYYIMDSKPGALLSCGIKSDISKEYFAENIKALATKKDRTRVLNMLNMIRVIKHDYISISGDTPHTKGKQNMILSITSFSSIFEMDLFNPERDRQTEQFLDRITTNSNSHPVRKSVASGSSNLEYLSDSNTNGLDIKRVWLDKQWTFDTEDQIHVINLVEGDQLELSGNFPSFTMHYAETLIIPADAKKVIFNPIEGSRIGILITTPGNST